MPEVVDGFVPSDVPVVSRKKKLRVLARVKAFSDASLRHEYYDSFAVNSKNFMDKSEGTEEWIAECEQLLGDLVDFAEKGDPAEVRQAFEGIFALLTRMDAGEDIVFFADEGGSWQVGVDWPKVLPAWFRCLATTATPEEYARLASQVIKNLVSHSDPKYWAKARAAATRAQKAALANLLSLDGPNRR